MITVLYINYSMEMGGIETLIIELAKNIKQRAARPEVLVFHGGGILEDSLEQNGIKVHIIDKKEGFDVSIVPKLLRIIKECSIRIIHTNNYGAWIYGLIAAKIYKKVCHVHTEHSNITGLKRKSIENILGRMTDEVVAVSHQVKTELLRNWNKKKSINVIHNGVDVAKFAPNQIKRKQVRREYGINDDTFFIGIVARLVLVKDHKTLFKAIKLLSSKYPNTHLFVIGDGDLRGELETERAHMGLTGIISFLGEIQDVHEILQALDVFVLSSLNEGLSVTLLEAMSVGLPIVATNVGGNPEVVEEGVSGFLVPSRNPELLANAIEKLLVNKALREKMSINARKRAVHHFSLKSMLDSYDRLYLDCLTRRRLISENTNFL